MWITKSGKLAETAIQVFASRYRSEERPETIKVQIYNPNIDTFEYHITTQDAEDTEIRELNKTQKSVIKEMNFTINELKKQIKIVEKEKNAFIKTCYEDAIPVTAKELLDKSGYNL